MTARLGFERGLHMTAMVAIAVIGCSSEPAIDRRSAVDHGRDLFATTKTSDSKANQFTCATCHRAVPDPSDARILPGAVLGGVLERPSFWGGQEHDALRAMNHCRYFFMSALRAWTPEDEDAKAMYAFLASLPPIAPGAQPFTTVPVAGDLPGGDRARGGAVYEQSCGLCHGRAHDGSGRLREGIPVLPEQSVQYFESLGFDRMQRRITFVEKVRHGPFLGLYGSMPLYSKEALGDADLGALLAFLDLY